MSSLTFRHYSHMSCPSHHVLTLECYVINVRDVNSRQRNYMNIKEDHNSDARQVLNNSTDLKQYNEILCHMIINHLLNEVNSSKY